MRNLCSFGESVVEDINGLHDVALAHPGRREVEDVSAFLKSSKRSMSPHL